MAIIEKDVEPMKDLEIISDPKTIKILFEPTRAAIVFKYLVQDSMTVKQLSDRLNKNPGTILHHIEKLKKAGLIVEERTEQTRTGIVQRYYRATAREFRLGISGMMAADGGVAKFARKRLESMIASLSVYGIEISESETPEAMELLRAVIERENYVNSHLSITDKKSYKKLSSPVRNDASRLTRRFALEEDEEYRRLRDKWHDFLRLHQKGGTKNE